MKKTVKKLALSKETLRGLEILEVKGAGDAQVNTWGICGWETSKGPIPCFCRS